VGPNEKLHHSIVLIPLWDGHFLGVKSVEIN
jgi:hypothetical protein